MTLRVDKIFAFIEIRSEGEKIMYYSNPMSGNLFPLMGSDFSRINQFRQFADRMKIDHKINYEVRYFEEKNSC